MISLESTLARLSVFRHCQPFCYIVGMCNKWYLIVVCLLFICCLFVVSANSYSDSPYMYISYRSLLMTLRLLTQFNVLSYI